MKRSIPKKNLQIKITLLIFLMLLSITVIVSAYLAITAEKKAMEIAINYAHGISKIIDSSLAYYMQKGHKKEISELIEELNKSEHIQGIHIFDNTKEIACINPRSFSKLFDSEYIDEVLKNVEYRPTIKVIKTKTYHFLAYYSPYVNTGSCKRCHIEEDKIGTLNVNIKLGGIYETILKQAKRTFMVLFISSILIAMLLSLLINMLIIKPIKKIEKGMEELMNGNYDVKVEIKSGDELELLSNNFNNMVDALNNANKTIDSMHKNMIHTDRLMTIGTLTASISHEIKNPLNSIMISTDILLDHCKKNVHDQRLKSFLEAIINDAQRIKDIIDQTLNFSRYETSFQENIDLKNLIKSIEIYSKRILFHREDIRFRLEDNTNEHVFIYGNKTNIEQMLINLLKNAVESVPSERKGDILLKIDRDDKFIEFTIQDNGVGIPKDKLDLIFKEFYSTKTNGTGLGLSIVKEIVENHNGELHIESEVDRGTKIVVKIPYTRDRYARD
ncbi:MAG: HAMP domain-containing histidine kinase [Calditerrivibrio sp.]|nr:HAMP domain-containing histidine kinase [Calditerrivibrio sp.]